MKKFNKLFFILLCCIGAMSVTSCLNSDGDSGLTDEEREAYTNEIAGPYWGGGDKYTNMLLFTNEDLPDDKNNPYKVDTLRTNINGTLYKPATDAVDDLPTFVINGVPGSILAKELDEKEHKWLKGALEQAPSKSIEGTYYVTNVYGDIIYLSCMTNNIEYKGLEYEGETHDVTIKFYNATLGNYYVADLHKVVVIPMLMATIEIDKGKEIVEIYNTSWGTGEKYNAALMQIVLCS